MNCDQLVDQIIHQTGSNIVLGVPLGAGKPNTIINALYDRAKNDQNIHLTICTALTLQRPDGNSDLEKRFIGLFNERIFGDYPDLHYEMDRVNGNLPPNIRVIEFYFAPGKYIGKSEIQRDYISSNYTHVVRDLMDRGINVIAQLVAKEIIDDQLCYSLSSNPDVTLDLAEKIHDSGKKCLLVAQVNENLPFMYGDAMVPDKFFDLVYDEPADYFQIFGPPKQSVPDVDFMIGLYCSALVKDDGEIQVGIGSLGDATIYGLLLRQNENEVYKEMIGDLRREGRIGDLFETLGETETFDKGLLGASEMIVDGFRQLYENGVIKKRVYDDVALQRLLNAGLIEETFDTDILLTLVKERVIHDRLTKADFDYLVHWGIFRDDVRFEDGHIHTADGHCISSYVHEPSHLAFYAKHCLGKKLRNGHLMHGGFFLGPQSFYQWLRDLPKSERRLIHMKSVQKINQLYGHELLDRLHRKNARFINTCMMYTLGGAAVSDGLEDGTVISGVGGQYNFVAMAQELPDGHSILNLRSTRLENGIAHSSIVPHYGHITIPKHLRDVVVTEYGAVSIRGKTDEEIIESLLNITDSRFQPDLMRWAKDHGKLRDNYEIPEPFTQNFPFKYQAFIQKFRDRGYFPSFPFGTELTEDELVIGKALKRIQADLPFKSRMMKTMIQGLFSSDSKQERRLLEKMGIAKPKDLKGLVYRDLVLAKLKEKQSS